METRNISSDVHSGVSQVPALSTSAHPVLHRVAEVWRQQNLSTQVLLKRLGVSRHELEQQTSPASDLSLSQLYKWQAALEVPVAELLIDPVQTLSPPVDRRARLVRLMKSVRSLQRLANSNPMQVLAERLAQQLVEIMPELVGVDSWPAVGQKRTSDDMSGLEQRALPDSIFDRSRLPLPDGE